MSQQKMILDKLERKVWRDYFKDGLLDIFFGLLMLGMALDIVMQKLMNSTSDLWQLILTIPGVLLVTFGKKYITYPRLGRVKFNPQRQLKVKTASVFLLISVLAGAGLFWLVEADRVALSGENSIVPLLIMWGAFAGQLAIIGYFMDFNRLIAYGVMMSFAFTPRYFFALNPAIPLGIMGTGVVIYGIGLLRQFLQDYPILQMDMDNESVPS